MASRLVAWFLSVSEAERGRHGRAAKAHFVNKRGLWTKPFEARLRPKVGC